MKAEKTSSRKDEHIKICLDKDIEFRKTNGFERYEFEHKALPELNYSDIDTSIGFMGKRFKLPFFIAAITGGAPGTEKINRNIAGAAQEMGIGMGLGSQRAMLEDSDLIYTYNVRDVAPDIFLLGNIGAAQISSYSIKEISGLVKDIKADGLAVHLNVTQEMHQPEGDRDWSNVLEGINNLCKGVDFPVVIKETGCGISGEVAKRLEVAGAACLDVAGAGGTSWSKVEHHRGSKTAEPFSEWGIPTAESLKQCRESVQIPLIASGGIRTGLDVAKSLALGASLAGFALPVLKPAMESQEEVVKKVLSIAEELKKTMILVGAKDISSLKSIEIKPI